MVTQNPAMTPGAQRRLRGPFSGQLSFLRGAGSEDEARQRDEGPGQKDTAPARALGSGAAQDGAPSATERVREQRLMVT